MKTLIKKHLPLIHSDENLKTLFSSEILNVFYRRNKNLKELLTLSLVQLPIEKKTVLLLVVIRVTSAKTT